MLNMLFKLRPTQHTQLTLDRNLPPMI